jgi:phosphatidylglycerol:prolipoprotein diacylglycerol transferase
MYPTLFKLGPLTIKTYGLLVALGMFAALQYILSKSKKANISPERVMDLVLYIIVAGLIGGRLAYVLLNFGYYSQNFLEVFKVWEGGMVFYGGLVLGALAGIIYVRRHSSLKLPQLADIFAPGIALAHVFGRLGCFFAGCCYGKLCELPWAVKFTNAQSLAPTGVRLHPTQLYEAAGNLTIFIFLNWYNKFNHRAGKTFWVYLFLYSMLRFHVEFLRGDDRGGFLLGMSPGQVISFMVIFVSIIYITKLKDETRKD